jgi:hypothetical protein
MSSLGQTAHCDSVHTIVDEMPKFGTADQELFMYIAKNLKFGACGVDEMKLLTWTIDSEGRMINIDATSLDGECKKNVIEQLKKFPSWKPGRHKGKPVCVKMNLRMCIKTG